MKRTTYALLAHGLLFLLAFSGCPQCPLRDSDDDSGETGASSSGTSGGSSGMDTESSGSDTGTSG